MALDPDMFLPCGRDPIDVVDAARRHRTDAHVRDCPYCREAVAADRDQLRIAQELGAAETPAPESLLPSVMATVWAELRPGKRIPLPTGFSSFVTELAAGTLLQHVLEALPQLEIRVCEVRLGDADPGQIPDPSPESASASAAPVLEVSVTAAAAYPAELVDLAEDIRRVTRETLATQFRLSVRSVDVSFADVFDPREETP